MVRHPCNKKCFRRHAKLFLDKNIDRRIIAILPLVFKPFLMIHHITSLRPFEMSIRWINIKISFDECFLCVRCSATIEIFGDSFKSAPDAWITSINFRLVSPYYWNSFIFHLVVFSFCCYFLLCHYFYNKIVCIGNSRTVLKWIIK